MSYPRSLTDLGAEKLLEGFSALVEKDRSTTAAMLAYIAEIDQRKLYLEHACSSMFAFCTERFHMSESSAGQRIWAARAARRFPLLLELAGRGEIHLSGILVLAKHLTEENHREVLARATHKSKRDIEALLAEVAPKPDVPSRIVMLPNRKPTKQAQEPPKHDLPPGRTRSQVAPLAPRRYKMQVTLSQETRDKLTELQELMSHQIPNGDPAVIVDRALDVLLDRMRKQKAALTNNPRRSSRRAETKTRTIPASVQREVFRRDEGRCAFVDEHGNRCTTKRFIEFHHKRPYALGGIHDVDNIELRCHAHNQYEADLDYGKFFMAAVRNQGRRPDP